ncbi:MAG TPA: transcription termination/antitermination NusG family protein [Candidatus Latescibacteria bacterium]|nr:transcription termination/antitermination NusG family protein [Candidatus Latescibacterota bacterium]
MTTVRISADNSERWYALVVQHQHERTVARNLKSKRLDALVPCYKARRRWSDRYKEVEIPLFPNYVLSRFCWPQDAPLLRLPGVRSVVSCGSQPAAIPEDEIDALKGLLNASVPLRPWPYLKPGQRVRIERGPLRGVEGTLLEEKRMWQIVVTIELLQRSVAAVIDRDAAVPI